MEIDSIVAELRQTYDSGKTRPIAWRKDQLRNLYHLIVVSSAKQMTNATLRVGPCGKDNRDRFIEAIFKDLGKPPVQVEVLETLCVVNEVGLPASPVCHSEFC